MRTIRFAAALAAVCSVYLSAQEPDRDPWPKTVEDFRTAVQTVLSDTGVPGAGLALVRMSGVEWAGGVGLADRDRKTPVTADTALPRRLDQQVVHRLGDRTVVPRRRDSISIRRSRRLPRKSASTTPGSRRIPCA
jgi:hypothetical protein